MVCPKIHAALRSASVSGVSVLSSVRRLLCLRHFLVGLERFVNLKIKKRCQIELTFQMFLSRPPTVPDRPIFTNGDVRVSDPVCFCILTCSRFLWEVSLKTTTGTDWTYRAVSHRAIDSWQ